MTNELTNESLREIAENSFYLEDRMLAAELLAKRQECKNWEAKWVVMADTATAWETMANERLKQRDAAHAKVARLVSSLAAVERQRDEWKHAANEWADAATNVPAFLACIASGTMTVEQVKEANRKDCEHAQSTQPQGGQP